MGTKKLNITLEGLHCSNCANKIEKRVLNIKNVEYSSFNFSTSILEVKFNEENDNKFIFNEVEKIVKSLEPHVLVKCDELEEEDTKKKDTSFNFHGIGIKKMITLSLGIIILLIVTLSDLKPRAELILYLSSYLLIGHEVIIKAAKNILAGDVFDENFLMLIATIGALLIKEFPEAVAVMLFYEIGETFQEIAVNRSRKSIADLMDIRPDKANLKINNIIKEVSPSEVSINDIIIVKPFEKVPLDGIIIDGASSLDTSALTGESIPRNVNINDEVLSGSINQTGTLTLRVTKDFSSSTVSKILDLVQNSSSKKAQTEQFITKFAKIYTPLVVILAIAIAFVPPMFIKDSILADWVKRALIFLVVSCPCALVISVPLGFFGGIGSASRRGVLIKGSNYLEALNFVDTIVFDKTGTLTKGVFEVSKIIPNDTISEDELLKYAALAEMHSSHPIGKSILNAYNKPLDQAEIKLYEEIPGHGTKAIVEDKTLLAGNSKLMDKFNIPYEKCDMSGTVIYVAFNGNFLGNILISDKIKDSSKNAITTLKNKGVTNLVMLTGDNKSTAENIAKDLGIDSVYSELLPQDKVEIFEKLMNKKDKKSKIAFVGDGINDAPVLARADIGIAMGGVGSDAAIEAADIVIMDDNLSKISNGIDIAKYTRKIVMQNITFALLVKVLVLTLGALGKANMWEAVFADVGVSLISVLNSMRVLKKR